MKAKIKARWLVTVPGVAKILVRLGQKIEAGEVLAKYHQTETKRFDSRRILVSWGKDKVEELQKLKGSQVAKGDTINKLVIPETGRFLGIDEFGNLLIEVETGEKQELTSPVAATVVSVDGGEIGLEFGAWSLEGEGVGSGRVWGGGEYRPLEKLDELDWHFENKVIFCRQMTLTMVNKAEVIGVKAMIAVGTGEEDFDKINVTYPIILLSSESFEILGQIMGRDKEHQLLLDVAEDRLLVV